MIALSWPTVDGGFGSSGMGDTNYEDVNMDSSEYSDTYSEGINSSSSFHGLSMSEDTEATSISSSAPKVPGNSPTMQPCARSAIGPETQRLSAMNHCVDPKLTSIGPTPPNEHITLGTWDWSDEEVTASGEVASQGFPVLFLTSQLPDLDQHCPVNDFDIAFHDNPWLHTWVTTTPDRLPNEGELASLKILSQLPETEIAAWVKQLAAWLHQHVSFETVPESIPAVAGMEETPRQKCVRRYRSKCRRSQRRFRYIEATRDETRVLECTHGCGQSFDATGQWTRHERYNIEEWKCHECKFMSARKDKLLKHLRQRHNFHSAVRKFHCHQLLHPKTRPCGFCGKSFDNWPEWLNHVAAHFQGRIAGGPWTMARWNKAIDISFDFGDSGDDGDDDDDQGHDDEDESSLDDDSSTADMSSHSTTKGGRASYGRGSNASSRSSGSRSSGVQRASDTRTGSFDERACRSAPVSNRSYRHALESVRRDDIDENSSLGLRRVSISNTKCRDPQSPFEAGAGYQDPANHSIAARANNASGGLAVKSAPEEDSTVGVPSIVTARPEKRESLNLGYFTPVFIYSFPDGGCEPGGPSRQYRRCTTNETEHGGLSKFLDRNYEYHEDTLPREKERGGDMNYNRSADQRYFYCGHCPFETKREWKHKQHVKEKHDRQYDRDKGNARTSMTSWQTRQIPDLRLFPSAKDPAPTEVGFSPVTRGSTRHSIDSQRSRIPDGCGVRGLSSLIVLERPILSVNQQAGFSALILDISNILSLYRRVSMLIKLLKSPSETVGAYENLYNLVCRTLEL